MEIRIPAPAEEIINKLNEHGYEAYVVGGCVRDMLLGREPGDWDITTSALPEQVKEVFRRTVDTGIQHGTVTVMMGKEGYEVTTYRIDGEYSDGHPVCLMSVTDGDTVETPIWDQYMTLVEACDSRGRSAIGHIERFAFYEEAKKAYAIIATSEKALYANIMLQKGVVTD